jgi:hypothetical protein
VAAIKAEATTTLLTLPAFIIVSLYMRRYIVIHLSRPMRTVDKKILRLKPVASFHKIARICVTFAKCCVAKMAMGAAHV